MNSVSYNRERSPERLSSRRGAGSAWQRQPSLLTQYWRLFLRQRWWIFGSIAVAAVIGIIVTLLMTPMYKAITRIEIQRESKNIVQIQGVEPESNVADVEFYQTQYGLLGGRSLAQSVAHALRLGDDPHFFELMGEGAAADKMFSGGRPVANDKATRDARERSASKLLLRHIVINPQRLSRLVDLEFSSPDPNLSARVADVWAQSFIESTLERRFEATSYARTFLDRRINQIRAKLETSERMLVAYAQQQRIVNLPSNVATATGSGADRPLLVDNLSQLNGELSVATAERIKAESRLSTQGRSTTEALQNNTVGQLRTNLGQAEADYARLLVQFDPQYPQAVAAAAQIERLKRAISQEEGRIDGSLDATYREATRREADLKGRISDLQTSLLDLRRRSIQYNIYQRDVDTNRALYDALLQRYKEIGVAGGVGVNNISIIDHSEVPAKPSSPRLLPNLAVALILGALVGCGIALAVEQLDETISDPNELSDLLDVPLLGTVPRLRGEQPVDALLDRKSSLVEAYLSIQTNLEFATDHGVPFVLAVTSARPGEGKSTTAASISTLLMRAGHRVMLIDADMRSPSVHEMFGLTNGAGLSNLLAGGSEWERVVHASDGNRPDLISAGPQPPNAAELLAGPRLAALLTQLRESYDHVVIDSPPVMGLADAPILAGQVESVVFAIESASTPISLIRAAMTRLDAAHAPIVGAVLTKFEERNAHQYGYGYGYGYGQDTRASA